MGVKRQVVGVLFTHHYHNHRMTFTRPDEYGVEETVTELMPGKPSIAHLRKWHCSSAFIHDICILCQSSR